MIGFITNETFVLQLVKPLEFGLRPRFLPDLEMIDVVQKKGGEIGFNDDNGR